MAKPPFAVLFDMDGVLLDSVEASMHARRQNAHLYGFTPGEMMAHSKPGRSLRDYYQALQQVRSFPVSFDDFANGMLEVVFDYLKKHSHGADPALVAFIRDLRAHNIPVGVGTSALKRSALKKLKIVQLHQTFDVVITADDVERHKPHPDIYQEAARQLNMPAQRCVVIEDALDGLTAAKTAGMKTIGYSKYALYPKDLAVADMVADDFSKLSYKKLSALFSA